ncbi:MAG: trigger factor, partial [Clostridia bacterium]
MDYSIQKLEKSRLEIAVNIEKEEWEACILDAYKKFKSRFKVEGFRPGKAPFNVIVSRYGKEVFYEDALDIALNKYYKEILDKEKDTEPVGRPDIDINEVSDEGVKLTLIVDVYPEVKLGEYTGLTIEKESADIDEDAADKEIEQRREQSARWIDITDRAAQKGDKVTIDYSGSVDGVKFDGGTAERQPLELGSNSFIPGFEEQVEGLKVGESRDISVTFPEKYHAEELAGKEAVFAVTLHEIKFKELPELDDEFAKDVSDFDTLEEYKADVTAKLLENVKKKAEYAEDDKIIDTVTANTEIDLPEAMVQEELERLIDDLKVRMSYSGVKLEDYLNYAGTTIDAIKEERREDAIKTLKTRLVLEAIIKKEEIKVEKEELDAEV